MTIRIPHSPGLTMAEADRLAELAAGGPVRWVRSVKVPGVGRAYLYERK